MFPRTEKFITNENSRFITCTHEYIRTYGGILAKIGKEKSDAPVVCKLHTIPRYIRHPITQKLFDPHTCNLARLLKLPQAAKISSCMNKLILVVISTLLLVTPTTRKSFVPNLVTFSHSHGFSGITLLPRSSAFHRQINNEGNYVLF